MGTGTKKLDKLLLKAFAACDCGVSWWVLFCFSVLNLGAGSDYAGFIGLAGVPAADVRYTFNYSVLSSYPLYHSVYETFHLVSEHMDPGFVASDLQLNYCELCLLMAFQKCDIDRKHIVIFIKFAKLTEWAYSLRHATCLLSNFHLNNLRDQSQLVEVFLSAAFASAAEGAVR